MRLAPYVIRTLPDLKHAVAAVAQQDAFVIDIETDGLNVATNWINWVGLATYGRVFLIPMGQTKGRLVRAAFSENVLPPEQDRALLKNGERSKRKVKVSHEAVFGDPGQQLLPATVFRELEPLLFGDQIKIGHNLKFDLMSIAKYYDGMLPEGPYEDTLVMQHIVDENRRTYELKEIVLDLFRIRNPEERKAFYPKLGKIITEVSIEDVARYLAKDVYDDWLLRQHLWEIIRAQKLEGVLRLEMDVYPAIMRMELAGTAIDAEKMAEIGTELEKELGGIEKRCWDIVGDSFSLTDVNRKRDLLFAAKPAGQGLKPLKTTPKTGMPVLDQATLETYAASNDLAALFLAWSEAAKVHSTYIVGLQKRMTSVKGISYVHTSFTQHGTVTGRLSSRDPNVQNIPRGSQVRALFMAPPGELLIVADYDQIELRVLAHFCGDPIMKGIFERGEDIHAGTAALILDKDISEVTHEERNVAGKTINFAVSYGAGVGRLVAAGIPEKRAKEFLDRYYQRFAFIRPWKHQMLWLARDRGSETNVRQHPPYVTTLFGRRRRLPDLYSRDIGLRGRAERQAINHIIQGSAAEIMKIAVLRVDRQYKGTPFKQLMTVHDELISSAPADRAEEAKVIVVDTMSGIQLKGEPLISVPLVVSCGVASRWSEAKA